MYSWRQARRSRQRSRRLWGRRDGAIAAGDNAGIPFRVVIDLDGRPRFPHDPRTTVTDSSFAPIVYTGACNFGALCGRDRHGDSDVNLLDHNRFLSRMDSRMAFEPLESRSARCGPVSIPDRPSPIVTNRTDSTTNGPGWPSIHGWGPNGLTRPVRTRHFKTSPSSGHADPVLGQGRANLSLLHSVVSELAASVVRLPALKSGSEMRRVQYAAFTIAIMARLASVLDLRTHVSRPIKSIVKGIREGAGQVDDAAGQIAEAPQILACEASDRAASIQLTNETLSRVAATTRENAGKAARANTLSGQTSASARAGEHGRGFAVVADEVRGLAQRCAEAAWDTTSLLQDFIRNTRDGNNVASDVNDALRGIVTSVTQVTSLMDEVAAATTEEAESVDHVNQSLNSIDRSSQQDAALTEESAAAAEQLSAQSTAMRQIVDELSLLADGAGKTAGG